MTALVAAHASDQQFSAAVWPWRGLGVALLFALLAHASAWLLINKSFAWSFKHPDSAASMSTRLLEPVPVSLLPATEPSRAAQPAPASPPKSETANKEPTVAQTAPEVPVEQKNEPIEPVALIKSEPNATESIAEMLPDTATSTASVASTNTTPTTGQPAPPGIKLQYPPSAQLQFDGTVMRKGTPIGGSGMLKWQTDGRDYDLSLEASALIVFSRIEKSVGQLSPQGLAPLRYSSSGTGRAEQATHFRPDLSKIQFSNNKPDADLLVGAQDQLSALIQLAGIIGGDPERYRIVNRIQMQVAGLNGAEVWEFNLQGTSDITVPAANMQALKLSRTPRNEFDQKLEVWLSPQLGYLPIRIRQSSSTAPEQDFTDLVLRKLP